MAIVYKITNMVNGKSYIGWTRFTVEIRWAEHKKSAARGKDNRKFYNAIRKYGVECWVIETLCVVNTNTEAKLKEIEFIRYFNSYNDGYNSTKGGDGNNGIVMSEESNRKRSIALLGIPKSYDRMKGKTHTSDSKEKISNSHKGKKKPWVKWTPEQIIKRAMTRRTVSHEQYLEMHSLRGAGYLQREIAEKVGLSSDMVKNG